MRERKTVEGFFQGEPKQKTSFVILVAMKKSDYQFC